MVPVVKSRRARNTVALLALILNLGGGPAAWGHWLDAAESPSPYGSMPAECHGSAAGPATGDTSPASLPCCAAGECHCAAPPAVATIETQVEWSAPARASDPARDTSSMPPAPLDDDLRPPIR
jgi:hypothetical protein